MQFSAASAAAILAFTTSTLAAPAVDYSKVDYSGVDFTKVTYPKGTGENLPSYPAPPGGWSSVKYPAGTGANVASTTTTATTGATTNKAINSFPFIFTSTYSVTAKGDQVRNGTTPAPGPSTATGHFALGLNSQTNTICYNITLQNVVGAYQSPARTATHIHEAVRGASGPPRIAFPNPVGDDKVRISVGCLTGPFVTGINGTDGKDTGSGFSVKQIEANPAGFFADSHTALFSLGVVRGQLA